MSRPVTRAEQLAHIGEAHRGRGELDPVAEARRRDLDLDELVDRVVETHLPPERRSTP